MNIAWLIVESESIPSSNPLIVIEFLGSRIRLNTCCNVKKKGYFNTRSYTIYIIIIYHIDTLLYAHDAFLRTERKTGSF